MKLTDDDTAALYREMTARRQRGPDCLDDEILLRAATNDLGSADRERIAAHIARCWSTISPATPTRSTTTRDGG